MSGKKKPAKRGTKSRRGETKVAAGETKPSIAETASAIIEKLDFTPKEQRFVEEYLIDLNATQAAIRAGYSEKTAKQIGYELLCKPHIQAAIETAMAERSARTRVTQDCVLNGIADLSFYDIAELFAEDGSLKPIHEIPPRMRMAIAGIEVEELWEGRGEALARIGNLHKVKLADRKGSLELLGRHLKLFTDRVEHDVGASLEDILTKSHEPK